MPDFIFSKDDKNIASIVWNVENKRMNLLTLEGMESFGYCVDQALSDSSVKGIVIRSAKKDFSGGFDLDALSSFRKTEEEVSTKIAFEAIMKIHKILRKLELSGEESKLKRKRIPVVWAAGGISAGIGTEIALACHHRILTNSRNTKIGLPEVKVGLFPFGGGTTRVVRMLGAMAASSILLEGKMLSASEAKSVGLVHETCADEDLILKAKEWILNASDSDATQPWDVKGYKVPGGGPYHPSGFLTFVGASAMIHSKTQGVYPAHKALMSAAYEGLLVPFETALKIEARWAVKLLNTPSTFNMIRSLFINKTALEKGAARPLNISKQSTKTVGIIGAGMMGAGIAYVSAMAKIDVILVDSTEELARKGKARIESILNEGIRRRKTTQEEAKTVLDRIAVTSNLEALSDSDLVIEAVYEDLDIKKQLIKAAEKFIPNSTIFASNTSTLPISQLAKSIKNPENFLGIHFFSPVHKMNLVEIIKGKKTNQTTLCKALDFVSQIRKTPIVVNDARFFYANRCIIPYINEGVIMIGEGVKPALIENAAKQLGMPVGPLQLIDETSIDLADQISRATQAALGDKYIKTSSDDVLEIMVKEKRLGRKAKAGFYTYNESGTRIELWKGISKIWPESNKQPSPEQVKNRLALIQAFEAVRALEEGVLIDIREGDVGAILGWGCLPWAGGPFSWLDLVGANQILDICSELTDLFGQRFKAPATIKDLAKKNTSFYQALV